ncbi:response regulator [Lampropedia puyangensis]|uniref:histidine kinase n=1 Tax=Lampropedia puyangensis TaxID=1330072 RepID=A0A4S8FBT8_9BURK|nr:ATP-binding protein [Lampropedia puyangensis]THU04481.1 response regulator [Lampropedia puyangensis]
MTASPQKILRIRRNYNAWVGNETLEDYALRYTPRRFRSWSEFKVANTAFGATSFLALEAIGAAIALSYGFTNAVVAIAVVALIIFLTGLPIAYYAARYSLDMDLLTRGAGFGYLGSTFTSLIYATFTFIFFALEAAILALALQLYVDWPLPVLYLLSSLVVIPLVMRGITMISHLQLWTQPIWMVLIVLPFLAIYFKHPTFYSDFTSLVGRISGNSGFDPVMAAAAITVAIALIMQIGEQVDYLRFLPEKTTANRWRWWMAVLISGPGWIIPGAIKMLGGAFLAFVALQYQISTEQAVEPTRMYLAGFSYVFSDPAIVVAVTVLFVIVSQLKINLTNAYAGSLAWSNFFARLTHSHPGRVVWLVFNVLIAVLLMVLGVFAALEHVLGIYSNVAIAWIGALVADLVINKPLGLSPKGIEFKRAYLYDINPVGIGAMAVAVTASMLAYAGALGHTAQAFSSLIALFSALGAAPLLAWFTKGKYYLARQEAPRWSPGQSVVCSICENSFESDDMAWCPAYGAPICSLCCTLESRCHDRCKQQSKASEQVRSWVQHWLPARLAERFNFRVAHFVGVTLSLVALLATILGLIYAQESFSAQAMGLQVEGLGVIFLKIFAVLSVVVAVAAWWVVLTSESRKMAQEESTRHNHLLLQEIDAHSRTDAALQAAKESADAANQAKTRYVAGMTHELRTPLNSILGYTQILLRNESTPPRDAIRTIHHSGEHMLGLIDGLLDLAKIEAGRLQLERQPLPFASFMEDVVRMIAPHAQAKGLQFHYSHAGRLARWVNADAKRLRQILINLLSNAVKFTEQGHVTLHVNSQREVLQFDIIDSGPGVAAQDRQRIFLPFERGSAGRRTNVQGTGLGLTITALLTSLMGGELTLADTSEHGSTFRLRLYLPEVPDPGWKAEAPQAIIGFTGPARTIVSVDDQPLHRQMVAGMLLPLGFSVREAASGTECLELLQDIRPDAILMDLSMDDLNGWDTADAIRQAGMTDTPIIIVSANLFDNQKELLQAHQCQAFVGKPVLESELLQALQDHLHLEWLTQAPPSPTTKAPPATPTQWDLTEQERAEILQLIQMGHIRGLHRALDKWHKRLGPAAEHEPHVQWFRMHLDAFDLESLSKALNIPALDNAPAVLEAQRMGKERATD